LAYRDDFGWAPAVIKVKLNVSAAEATKIEKFAVVCPEEREVVFANNNIPAVALLKCNTIPATSNQDEHKTETGH
jgi:hypothetical protein